MKRKKITSGVITCDLSDHYSIFAIISNVKNRNMSQQTSYLVRDMSNFNSEVFLDELAENLNSSDRRNVLSINKQFEKIVKTLKDVTDHFAPKRKPTRKERRIRQKPWITGKLVKSIQIKDKMFRQAKKNRNNLDLYEKYKSYRNVLNRSIKLAKQNYYHRILNEHKGNT